MIPNNLRGKYFNNLFIEELEEACKNGITNAVATGHSHYWKEFMKVHGKAQGTCHNGGSFKLSNGAVVTMVVRFDANCKAIQERTVVGCRLLYGSFEGLATGYEKDTSAQELTEINDGLMPGHRQILLIAQRHGRSHFNEASEIGGKAYIGESTQYDSPLWPI